MPMTVTTVERMRQLDSVLDTMLPSGSSEGLRELHNLLLRDGVCESIDPGRININGKMGCIMCADPNRQGHMHDEMHRFFHPNAHRNSVAPIKIFGGPLLFLVNGEKAEDVPLSPDAAADAMSQLLIGQRIAKLNSYALIFHFPCGFACRTGKTRREVIASFPEAKVKIRQTWRDADIPQLKNIVGLLHFDFGGGEMAMVRIAKGYVATWLKNNEGKYPELLDVL